MSKYLVNTIPALNFGSHTFVINFQQISSRHTEYQISFSFNTSENQSDHWKLTIPQRILQLEIGRPVDSRCE